MANKTFDQLDAASPLTGNEILPVNQGLKTVKTTVQAIASLVDLSGKADLVGGKVSGSQLPDLLALGETSGTAYRGDRGKTAYDHSQDTHAPTDAEKNVQSDWSQSDNTDDSFIKNKPTALSDFSADATHRLVTDTEKSTWDAKLSSSHLTDFTHADIAHNNRSALDAVQGTNTGDETATSIKTKLGITTLSGANTGDQDLSSLATKTELSGKQASLAGFTGIIKVVNGVVMGGATIADLGLTLPPADDGKIYVMRNQQWIELEVSGGGF